MTNVCSPSEEELEQAFESRGDEATKQNISVEPTPRSLAKFKLHSAKYGISSTRGCWLAAICCSFSVVWSHDAKSQQSMSFDDDRQGLPRKESIKKKEKIIEEKIASISANVSHCHINHDFRFKSQ